MEHGKMSERDYADLLQQLDGHEADARLVSDILATVRSQQEQVRGSSCKRLLSYTLDKQHRDYFKIRVLGAVTVTDVHIRQLLQLSKTRIFDVQLCLRSRIVEFKVYYEHIALDQRLPVKFDPLPVKWRKQTSFVPNWEKSGVQADDDRQRIMMMLNEVCNVRDRMPDITFRYSVVKNRITRRSEAFDLHFGNMCDVGLGFLLHMQDLFGVTLKEYEARLTRVPTLRIRLRQTGYVADSAELSESEASVAANADESQSNEQSVSKKARRMYFFFFYMVKERSPFEGCE